MKLFGKTKPVKLWLDDCRDPKSSTMQMIYYTDNSWTWVKNVEEAKKFLNKGIVFFISFDNDLGDGLEEGYQLANWIEEQAANGILKRMGWQIHSSNPVAANKIKMAMLNAEKFWVEHELV